MLCSRVKEAQPIEVASFSEFLDFPAVAPDEIGPQQIRAVDCHQHHARKRSAGLPPESSVK